MATTNHLAITLVDPSQAQKEVTVNQAFSVFDSLMNTGAKTRTLNTPPASPTAGDVYIIGSSPTGAWAGQAFNVTYYDQVWRFIVPNEGLSLWVNDENVLYSYTGTAWTPTFTATPPTFLQNLTLLGVNATADSTNKLSVASSAVLFNHIGADMQVKINKNAGTNKASFVFQDNFSARAEFGLLGDDNFTLKVSNDGSTFFNSLKMLSANGRAALKANASSLSAAGTTQATATAITNQTNEFTTVGSGQGAVLPSPEVGEFIFIANAGANALSVYPASGHTINALGTNVAFSLATGKNAQFWAAASGKWYAILSA